MKEIIGINHIGIRVTNLESAREFYERLGFIFIIGPIGPEPVAIMEHPSGVNINLILNANTQTDENILMDVTDKYPGYTHIALDVNNIKEGLIYSDLPAVHGQVFAPAKPAFPTSVWVRYCQNQCR